MTKKALLIIEDDPYVRRMYQRLFDLNGYDVKMAEDGAQGIEMAKALKPVMILLDIMMPGMDGLQVLEKLKADPETKDIIIVMLTNLGEEKAIKKATALGASDFIIKSNFTPEQVKNKVQTHLKANEEDLS